MFVCCEEGGLKDGCCGCGGDVGCICGGIGLDVRGGIGGGGIGV